MNDKICAPLQTRELFHLQFLRWFGRKIRPDCYALKGGANLRFFFQSIRYSEDLDLDIRGVRIDKVKKLVMEICSTRGFEDSLKPFGIDKIILPDITKAKQTETTQRFKIHLLTLAGEDLLTKIEFSRRGSEGSTVVEPVSEQIVRSYRMPPILISHYDSASAVWQKILALAKRSAIQARDVFDLFHLSSQCEKLNEKSPEVSKSVLKTAHENIFLVEFAQFRDTVVAYLEFDDQTVYSSEPVWNEIKLRTADFFKRLTDETR